MSYSIIKLPVYNHDNSVIIELEVLFDEKFKDLISTKKWRLCYKSHLWSVYSETSVKKKKTRTVLHRFLWEYVNGSIPENKIIDHVNHNSLDNRLANLRLVSKKENSRNTRPVRGSKSKYKGIYFTSGKWRAMIQYNNKKIHIGYFSSEEEAAQAYDVKALELFGEFGYLNFK